MKKQFTTSYRDDSSKVEELKQQISHKKTSLTQHIAEITGVGVRFGNVYW